jgi:hypothetical protein
VLVDMPDDARTPSWRQLHPGDDPRVEVMIFARLRETPGAERFAAMRRLTIAARRLALAGLRHRHPDASAAELQRRLADLLLGEELAAQVYGRCC